MKKLLFANACLNREKSRTLRLGRELISLLQKKDKYEITELVLEEDNIKPLLSAELNKRLELQGKQDFSGKAFNYAHQFARADCIVFAAPYWDFGFPAILKTYIEAVSVPGIVYRYGEGGRPVGMCKAEKIYYVTTRGGYIGDDKDLGFATTAQLAAFYGIKEAKCISADGFDIPTTDIEASLKKAISEMPACI